MMKKIEKLVKKFVLYMFETYKNKLAALALVGCGMVVAALDGDATFLSLVTFFAIPLFFINKNMMN